MKSQDYEIVRKLKEKLFAIVDVVDLRIFGSRASGTADEFSDLDVFLEVPQMDQGLKERIWDAAWEVGLENNRVISILVFTKDEIENSPLRVSPIVINILKEGISV